MRQTIFRPAIALALAAMLLRALLPAGWMPNPDGTAHSPFVICTIDGPRHLAPLGSGPAHRRAGAPCPFAATAASFAPPHAPTPAPAGTAAEFAAPLPADAVVRHTIIRDANRSRAPPSLA